MNQMASSTISPAGPEEPGFREQVRPSRPKRPKALLFSLLLLLLLSAIFGAAYLMILKPKPLPSWKGIRPGVSKKTEVIERLGRPKEEKETAFGTAFLYESGNPIFPNTIFFDKKANVFSINLWLSSGNSLRLSDFKKQYGPWEKEMYNKHAALTRTYLFPQKGIALVANEIKDEVYEIQYFVPMSLGDYLSIYGQGLSEENPYAL